MSRRNGPNEIEGTPIEQPVTTEAGVPNAGQRLHVVFHTPIASNYLDEKRLTSATEDELHDAIEKLNEGRNADDLWHTPTVFPLNLQGYGEPLLSSLRSRMPGPVLETDPLPTASSLAGLEPGIDSSTGDWLFRSAGESSWTLHEIRLSIWNIGTAMLTVSYLITKPDGMDWKAFAAIVDEVQEESTAGLGVWARRAIEGFEAIADDAGWTQKTSALASAQPFWSDPLWTYQVLTVVLPMSADSSEMARIAKTLVRDGRKCSVTDHSETIVRIGLSAACVTKESDYELSRALNRLLQTHTAAWASAITLDSFISEELFALRLEHQRAPALEKEAHRVLQLADRVRFFLAVVEGVPLHLRPEDRAIWECIDTEWRSPAHRQALSKKLDGLRAVQGDLINQVSGRGLRRLNFLVFLLTVIGGLASAVAIYAFWSSATDLERRVLALAAIALPVLGVLYWATASILRTSMPRTRRLAIAIWVIAMGGSLALLTLEAATMSPSSCELAPGSSVYGDASWSWIPPGIRCEWDPRVSGAEVVILRDPPPARGAVAIVLALWGASLLLIRPDDRSRRL